MKKILIIISFILIAFTFGCTKKERIVEISANKFLSKIENKDTFALYIGNENCSYCVAYKPTLEEVLNDYDISIYHLDNSKLTSEDYNKINPIINVQSTPTIVFIKNGEEKSTLDRIVGKVSYEKTVNKFKKNGIIK